MNDVRFSEKKIIVVAVLLLCVLVGIIIGFALARLVYPDCRPEKGVWLTAPLVREGEDLLTYTGTDLTLLVNGRGCAYVYTYFAQGDFEQTEWIGYQDGKNIWRITSETKENKSSWKDNSDWRIDFLWPAIYGEYPPNAYEGTSSR